MESEKTPSEPNKQFFYPKPMPQYSVAEYVKHAAPIKEMQEWVIADLQFQLTTTQQHLRDKEVILNGKIEEAAKKDTQLKLAQLELSQLKDTSIAQFGLGLSSALLAGIGVNLVTSSPPVEWGWGLIGLSVLLQFLSFIITYLAKRRKSD